MTIEDLKKRKIELGYTNEMIAARSGVPLGTVQKFFGGATTRPRYNTLQSIQCVLFPEDHSPKEAALYRAMEQTRALDHADSVSESTAFDEYTAETTEDEHKRYYEEVMSWKKPGEFTIEDWRNLPDARLAELIDGVIYDRNYPTLKHQHIVLNLSAQLLSEVGSKSDGHCMVLSAPAGVQLNKEDNKNVLQPDILIVCDKEKYSGENEIVGAPDFVAEVLSPSTETYDKSKKLKKYWKAGVREAWMISMEVEEIDVYMFDNKEASIRSYSFDEQIPLGISGGKVVIDFKNIADRMHGFFG